MDIPDRIKRLHTRDREAVRELCEAVGYGFVMHEAEKLWREKATSEGLAGSEHTTGPCAVFMVPCPCRKRVDGPSCDWCCGALRVTERVAQAIREADHAD